MDLETYQAIAEACLESATAQAEDAEGADCAAIAHMSALIGCQYAEFAMLALSASARLVPQDAHMTMTIEATWTAAVETVGVAVRGSRAALETYSDQYLAQRIEELDARFGAASFRPPTVWAWAEAASRVAIQVAGCHRVCVRQLTLGDMHDKVDIHP